MLPGRRIHSAAATEGLGGRARSGWRRTERDRGSGAVQAERASAVLSRSRAGVSGEGEDQQAQQDKKRQVWMDARVTLASEEREERNEKIK